MVESRRNASDASGGAGSQQGYPLDCQFPIREGLFCWFSKKWELDLTHLPKNENLTARIYQKMKTWPPKPTKKWKKLSHKLRKTIKIPKWTSRNPIKVWNSWKHTKIGSVAPQKKRIWQKRSPRNSRNITFWPSRNIKRCFFASQWHSIIHFLAFRGKQKINIVIFFWHGNSKKWFLHRNESQKS